VPDSRTKFWFALFVLAVFCAGAAAGVFVGQRTETAGRPGRPGNPSGAFGSPGGRGGPGAGPPPEVLLERLTRDLDLTARQRAEIQTVLRSGRDRVEQLQREVRGRFDEEQHNLHAEIRKVLTPEQQKRFERIVEQGRRGRTRGKG
jgi:Spy/CpxP family protein refolding chaperone